MTLQVSLSEYMYRCELSLILKCDELKWIFASISVKRVKYKRQQLLEMNEKNTKDTKDVRKYVSAKGRSIKYTCTFAFVYVCVYARRVREEGGEKYQEGGRFVH